MNDMTLSEKHSIGSTEELLAYSLVMETEAVERVTDLADQMETHHNHEVADLFRKLAEIEGNILKMSNRFRKANSCLPCWPGNSNGVVVRPRKAAHLKMRII